jgi:putative effector of murein hydrolase
VVALAVPLYTHMSTLRRTWPAVLIALSAGSVTAAISAVATAWAMGAPLSVVLSLAPKSVTSPIAMGISERIGGTPALTAVLVILTGVVGAITGGWVLDMVRVRSAQARGLALGTASHGIGTTAAMQMSEVAGAYSGLAMGLNGAVTAIIIPMVIPVLVKWLG